jgi:hypothetical protein
MREAREAQKSYCLLRSDSQEHQSPLPLAYGNFNCSDWDLKSTHYIRLVTDVDLSQFLYILLLPPNASLSRFCASFVYLPLTGKVKVR